MQALSGITFAFALLVVLAGGAKILQPDGTRRALRLSGLPDRTVAVRLLGVVEVAVGLAVVLLGGRIASVLLAVAYLAFTAFALRQRQQGAGCGCFGAASTPVTWIHVAVDAAGTLVIAAAAARKVPSLPDALADQSLAGAVGALALLATVVVLLRLALTALPDLDAAIALHDTGANA